MLKITILTVGKMKDIDFKNSFGKYLKRISPYAVIHLVELAAEPFYDNSNKEKIKQQEGKKIIGFLKKHSQDKILILDEKGKQFDSIEFAEFLFKKESEHIIFIIGGTLGISREVLNLKNAESISLSKLTFPHEMAKVILTEQIYRAIAINKNKSYHY